MDTTHTQFIASIILPLMLLICTAVYTVINYKMIKESKATRLQKITPNIVAYLSTTEIHGSGTLILYITNIGEGVARNVKCEIYKDFEWIKGDPLCNRGIFKSGINVFPPQYKLQYYILTSCGSFDFSREDAYIEFDIICEDILGTEIRSRFKLSFKEMDAQNYSSPPNDYKNSVVYHLKNINETLKKKG